MNLGDIKPIPSGFLSQLLREFGIEWTHLVIISGVAFSSFGLQGYVNPGLWILGTISSFSLVYLFRQQITGNFTKTALLSAGCILILIGGPVILLMVFGQDIRAFLKTWVDVSTFYISVAIGIPIGFSILSYRAQDEFLRTPLPPALEKAAKDSVWNSDFVQESVKYEIEFEMARNNDVLMRFDVTMNMVNRLKRSASYRDIFDPAGRDKRFLYAAIDTAPLNEQDPERLTQKGLIISHDAEAGEKFTVAVRGQSIFYGRDSELVGVYYPCASLSILIRKPPKELAVHVQSMLRRKVDPKHLPSGDLLVQWDEGVLPFQGVRIFWEFGPG